MILTESGDRKVSLLVGLVLHLDGGFRLPLFWSYFYILGVSLGFRYFNLDIYSPSHIIFRLLIIDCQLYQCVKVFVCLRD